MSPEEVRLLNQAKMFAEEAKKCEEAIHKLSYLRFTALEKLSFCQKKAEELARIRFEKEERRKISVSSKSSRRERIQRNQKTLSPEAVEKLTSLLQ